MYTDDDYDDHCAGLDTGQMEENDHVDTDKSEETVVQVSDPEILQQREGELLAEHLVWIG